MGWNETLQGYRLKAQAALANYNQHVPVLAQDLAYMLDELQTLETFRANFQRVREDSPDVPPRDEPR